MNDLGPDPPRFCGISKETSALGTWVTMRLAGRRANDNGGSALSTNADQRHAVTDGRLQEALRHLHPPPGTKLWHGGATVLGALRGLSPEVAAWKPSPDRHSIWALSLHVAYWNYAVRRRLTGEERGGFPRSPSDFPAGPMRGPLRPGRATVAWSRSSTTSWSTPWRTSTPIVWTMPRRARTIGRSPI